METIGAVGDEAWPLELVQCFFSTGDGVTCPLRWWMFLRPSVTLCIISFFAWGRSVCLHFMLLCPVLVGRVIFSGAVGEAILSL